MSVEREKTTFYFARLNIDADQARFDESGELVTGTEDFRETVLDYVSSKNAVVESDTGDWYFGAYDPHDDYILGEFGKQYEKDPKEYNPETGTFEEGDEPNYDSDISLFVLHFPTNLLIYNTRDRVRHKNFRKNFAEGFNSRYGIDLQIHPINNTQNVDEIIHKYPVKEAEFKLEPSNPHNEPEWENLDEHIKEMVAKKLDIEIESVEGSGLNFGDGVLGEILAMSRSDYGQFELVYTDNGQPKVVSSETAEPVRKEEEDPETIGRFRNVADELIDYGRSFL